VNSPAFDPSKPGPLFAAAILTVVAATLTAASAQAPSLPPAPGAVVSTSETSESRDFPPPENLKVLPKNLTGQQVHAIMKQWTEELGVHRNACHLEDRFNMASNGRPQLDFMDDSKGMKRAARLMFTMTEEINSSYIAKVEGSGLPVSCGSCHRGQVTPEPYSIAPLAGENAAHPSADGTKGTQPR
jgi:hypothetical protein